jgi:hypothetical protein
MYIVKDRARVKPTTGALAPDRSITMTKATAIKALENANIRCRELRNGTIERYCDDSEYDTLYKWALTHFGDSHVYPFYSPCDWRITIELERSVIVFYH